MNGNAIYTISEITASVKQLIEENFNQVSLIGEISNFKPHFSGHWYFTLKDKNAQINCTMWKGVNSYVFFTPQDGMKVIVTGKLSVYPPRGSYQIDVRSMKPAGEGELQAAFEKLKLRLSSEGLFEAVHKKSIPRFPEKIGVVTAIDGAALRDMISVLNRRYPIAELIIAASKVQGQGAAEEIVRSIRLLNTRKDIDVIIVGRGGGSIEDLWAFNEEIVAREIFASSIPIISAVGHEIDFTISDFVADLRAPTPTAAMELATPEKEEIFAFIADFSYNSSDKIFRKIRNYRQEINSISNSYGFKNPQGLIKTKIQFLDNLLYRINNSTQKIIVNAKNNLELINATIEANNVDKILKKGFTLIKQKGSIIPKAKNFSGNDDFIIKFVDKEVVVNRNG
ncbi:MAG: exodeoxyribonuclease VII large subunit [Bacteroidetes bacterium]|nr:exodeoxyribonuclease VII large subunit [Bacteroidota bacterium]